MPLTKIVSDSIADGTVVAADIANGTVTGSGEVVIGTV